MSHCCSVWCGMGLALVEVHAVFRCRHSRWTQAYFRGVLHKKATAPNAIVNNCQKNQGIPHLRGVVPRYAAAPQSQMVRLNPRSLMLQLRRLELQLSTHRIWTPARAFLSWASTIPHRLAVHALLRKGPLGYAVLEVAKVIMLKAHDTYDEEVYGSRYKLLFTDRLAGLPHRKRQPPRRHGQRERSRFRSATRYYQKRIPRESVIPSRTRTRRGRSTFVFFFANRNKVSEVL